MNKKGQGVFSVLFVILLFVLAVFLIAGFSKVDARHYGIQDRFGVVKDEVLDSGLHWTGVFTSVYEFPHSTQSINIERAEAVDIDGQDVYATIAVNYNIKSKQAARNLYLEAGRQGTYQTVLNLPQRIEEGFKQVTVQYEALDILEKRSEVKEKASSSIRTNIPEEYFDVQTVILSNIGYRDSFSNAIQAKKDAEQLALKAERDLERVKFEQQQKIEKAKAEAEALRLQKQEITAELNKLRMIEKWNGVLPTVVMTGGDSSGTPLLDLTSIVSSPEASQE